MAGGPCLFPLDLDDPVSSCWIAPKVFLSRAGPLPHPEFLAGPWGIHAAHKMSLWGASGHPPRCAMGG